VAGGAGAGERRFAQYEADAARAGPAAE